MLFDPKAIGALFVTFLLVMLPPLASAEPTNVQVGFQQVNITADGETLVGGIWYPSTGVPVSNAIGPYTQYVVPSGPVSGQRLPLVVISHGGGGSYASHFDTAVALARAGFVVASISHAGDTFDDQSKVLMIWRRAPQLSRLIDYVLNDWSSHGQVDADQIGGYGFSNGGFTMLVEAGGTPDVLKIDDYCKVNPQHDLCTTLRSAGIQSVASVIVPPSDAWKADSRIRAIALAAPAFDFTFDRSGLSTVNIPVQLWRGAKDRHQPDPWYETYLNTVLPRGADYRVVPDAGHYAFLPPCPKTLAEANPDICVDEPGFDRQAFHNQLNAELVKFFNATLRGGKKTAE